MFLTVAINDQNAGLNIQYECIKKLHLVKYFNVIKKHLSRVLSSTVERLSIYYM